MRYIIKLLTLAVSLLLMGAAAYWVTPIATRYLRESQEPALLRVKWGMTPERVQSALGFPISKDKREKYFDIAKISFPTVAKNRYTNYGLISDDFRLWEYETAVYFTFFDNQLFEYKAEIRSIDADALHATIMNHLSSKYGVPTPSDAKRNYKDFIRDAEWNGSAVRIAYWLVRENSQPNENATHYVARVRATYLPLENTIAAEGVMDPKIRTSC